VDQITSIVKTKEYLITMESLLELTLKNGKPDITRQPKTEFPQKISEEFLTNN
jgi:hypothetical protein